MTIQSILDELTPLLKLIDDAADRAFNEHLAAAGEAVPQDQMNQRLLEAAQQANAAVPADQRNRAAALTLALCDAYLVASPDDRKQTRDRVHDALTFHHHLIGFNLHAAAQVTRAAGGADAQTWLRRGLAAASIENNVLDPRNTALALGELLGTATRTTVDATQAFADVAAMSDDTSRHPELPPMRDFLAGFTKAAFFGANVESNLN
jgi:hypothetical protein